MDEQVLQDVFNRFCGAARQNFEERGFVQPFIFVFPKHGPMIVVPMIDKDALEAALVPMLRKVQAEAVLQVTEAWVKVLPKKTPIPDGPVSKMKGRAEMIMASMETYGRIMTKTWKITRRGKMAILTEQKIETVDHATYISRFTGDYFKKEIAKA